VLTWGDQALGRSGRRQGPLAFDRHLGRLENLTVELRRLRRLLDLGLPVVARVGRPGEDAALVGLLELEAAAVGGGDVLVPAVPPVALGLSAPAPDHA
jgi:hypothetical protein